jgi:hypothetical protein
VHVDEERSSDHGTVKPIDGVGLGVALTIDGELHYSRLFRDWVSLEQAARGKRGDFENRGWTEE